LHCTGPKPLLRPEFTPRGGKVVRSVKVGGARGRGGYRERGERPTRNNCQLRGGLETDPNVRVPAREMETKTPDAAIRPPYGVVWMLGPETLSHLPLPFTVHTSSLENSWVILPSPRAFTACSCCWRTCSSKVGFCTLRSTPKHSGNSG